MDAGKSFDLCGNNMEASVLVDMCVVKRQGFSMKRSGGEHVDGGWYSFVSDTDQLVIEDINPKESYAYVWGDGNHKTSGDIDNRHNFDNHKNASRDFGEGQKLSPIPFYGIKWILESVNNFYQGSSIAWKFLDVSLLDAPKLSSGVFNIDLNEIR